MAAFEAGFESVPAFELDTQLTADGVVVVLHDELLGRVNDGELGRPVCETSWAELSRLDAGQWFDPGGAFAGCRIPMLRQVLDSFRSRAHIHLVRACAWAWVCMHRPCLCMRAPSYIQTHVPCR